FYIRPLRFEELQPPRIANIRDLIRIPSGTALALRWSTMATIHREHVFRVPCGHRRDDDLLASLGHLWSIVIAPDGESAPDHYSAAHRSAPRRSTRARFQAGLRTTVERVARLVPRQRLVMALTRRDTGWAAEAVGDVRWIIQPAWRGSAAEVILAALAIAAEDR